MSKKWKQRRFPTLPSKNKTIGATGLRHIVLLGIILILISALSSVEASTNIGILFNPKVTSYKTIIEGFKSTLTGQNDVQFVLIPLEKKNSKKPNIKNQNLDFIFCLGWNATKTGFSTKIPGIFTMVHDPIHGGFIKENNFPKGMLTGISWDVSPQQKLGLLSKAFPLKNKLGVLYTEASKNSLKSLETAATLYDYEIISYKMKNSKQIEKGVKKLNRKKPSLLIPLADPVSLDPSNMKKIIEYSTSNKIPVIGLSQKGTELGALMSFHIDHHQLGVQSAKLLAKVIEGKKPYLIELQEIENFQYSIHKGVAEIAQTPISEEILNQANALIE